MAYPPFVFLFMGETLQERIQQVQANIRAAASRSGRDPASVTLVAVTKQVPPEMVREAMRAGLFCFGESRVEEAAEKIPLCPDAVWHLVGHLQGRKIKTALPLFRLIHSVDSLKLMERIDAQAAVAQLQIPVLLEVNVSGEKTKYGFDEKTLLEILPQMEKFPHLRVEGLMTLAPLHPDPESSRPFFRRLRDQAEAIDKKGWSGIKMRHLSMGMSQDYEVAIEEGATLVRIGRALFGAP